MSLAVLVARVPDDLPREGEQLVAAGQHGGHQAADLRGSFIHGHLPQKLNRYSNHRSKNVNFLITNKSHIEINNCIFFSHDAYTILLLTV